ncbi:Vegetative incompatibility protein HET-E-1 [Colletotrichum fructicola Nara gc5]|uniref:Vegetative incompatibility protein HET-E-1 n=1 Tax=Colletotrichum fructicola (strain Nara gc5) TaxID=1213859 RepID=A0A7J6JRW0_COLFN|nr:Vegetative incompatibility protein HET-E-1 [Colletotrichum fructicola Nara gc5]
MSSQHAGQKRRRRSTNADRQDDSIARVHADFTNSGGGTQHNNLGAGNQNNNSGLGTQYNANSITFVSKEKDTFLADLRVTDPRDDKTRIERTKGHLLRDSYRWILEHDDFCQWRAERRLLWIKGGPGKGKTMLLCGVIDELLAMGYKSTFFFFCQATDARLSSATSVLRSLLYLMIDQSPVLLDSLRNKYDQAGAGIFDDVNTWDVLCKMILSAVSHPSLQDVILVIDALDECNSGLDQLISFIIDLTAHVKIIASSRPDSRIERALAPASNDTKIYLSLEMNEGAISAAVEHYIYHKVDELAILKEFDDEMKINVRNYLCTKADNTFLWVALVYEQLSDNRVAKRHIQRKLHAFLQGLDSLYDQILTRILESLDADDCTEVVAVMSVVSRPLGMVELAFLIDQVQFLEEIVAECGSSLTIREGVIYFVHQSAKEFLVRQADRIMSPGVAQTHGLVTSKLLQSMSITLRRNMYGIDKHGIALDQICTPALDPLAPIRISFTG